MTTVILSGADFNPRFRGKNEEVAVKTSMPSKILSLLLGCLLCTLPVQAETDSTDDSVVEKVGKGAVAVGKEVGKGAAAVGKEVGEAGVDVATGVGKGVKKVGEEALDLAKKAKEFFFDPVIVSATRLPSVETRLSNMPANATLITRDTIDAHGARTVQEALQHVESVNIFDQVGNDVDRSFNIRGFTENQETAVILDGVRVNETDLNVFNANLIDTNTIEHMELVRGTSSALFGDSALGGVLNISTRQPAAELFHTFGKYEFGSFRYQNVHAGASGTVRDEYLFGVPGNLKYYFSGTRRLNGGYRDNGDTRATFFDWKAGYELADASGDIMASVKYTDQENHNPGELTLEQVERNRQQSVKSRDNRKWESLIMALDVNKTLFDEHIEMNWNVFRRMMDVNFTATSITTNPNQINEFETNSTQAGFVGQLTYRETLGEFDNTLTGGIEYTNAGDFNVKRPLVGGGAAADSNLDKDTTGLYLQNTLNIYDRLIVQVGLRHDEVDFRFEDHLNPANTQVSDFDETTAKVGVVVKPIKNIDVYGSFSEAFKAPGSSELFNISGFGLNDTGLKPEKADAYEVGARVRWHDMFAGNVTFFHIDTFDEIQIVDTGGFVFRNQNIGETRRYGLETSCTVRPVDFFDAYFTYTYTDAIVRKTTINVASGRELGLVPQNRFTAGVHVGPVYGFNVWLDSIFVGRQFPQDAQTNNFSLDPIEPYYVFNGKLAYEYKGIELFCKVNNIFDRKYFDRSIWAFDFNGFQYRYFVTPAPEREIIAGLTMAWGTE